MATTTQTQTTIQKAFQAASQEKESKSRQARRNSKPKSPTQAQPKSTSKKSESASKPSPRRSRTLKRNPIFRDIIDDDLPYLWAAYQKGAFQIKEGLSAKEFTDFFIEFVYSQYAYAWTFEHKGKPIGVLFGKDCGPFILVGDMVWMPWATKRQRVEHVVNFLNEIRKHLYILLTCDEKDLSFYNYIARHGVIRRVGTLHGMNHSRLWEIAE